jgi:hypothetical protein
MELNLSNYSITRPHKVEWMVPTLTPDPLDIIKSKTTKKFLKNHLDDFLKEYQLTVTTQDISETDYLEWLKYYRAKMEENNFDIFAKPEWYPNKVSEGFKVYGIYLRSTSALLGTGIVTCSRENKFIINFKASDKTDFSNYRNASLGTIIEYYFLKLAYDKNATEISSGRSSNAFGVINKLGYLNFKLRYGYQPVTVVNEPYYQSVEVLEGLPVCFYGFTSSPDQLKLYVYNHSQELPENIKETLSYTEFEVIA